MATKPAPSRTTDGSAGMRGADGPRPVPGLVQRPRLFAMLDRGMLGPVTLLSAPAGSGKTMLVASWLRSAPAAGAVAWVGVERDEQDATRFWAMVTDAMRRSGVIPTPSPRWRPRRSAGRRSSCSICSRRCSDCRDRSSSSSTTSTSSARTRR